MGNEGMIILPDDKLIINMLTPEDAKQVFLALLSDDKPELSSEAKIVYTVIHERNKRLSEKRAKAGAMSGNKQGNKNASKQAEHGNNEQNEQNEQNENKRAKRASVPYRTDTGKEKEKNKKDLPPKAAATDSPDSQKSSKNKGYTQEFENFWQRYPRRNGKKGSKDEAFEQWEKQLQGKHAKNGADPPTEQQLIAAVKAYAAFCEHTTQYPQDARTWLGKGNHWREFLPNANMSHAPPDFDLTAYCTDADGQLDLKKFERTRRAMEGDEDYAEYLPEGFKKPG